MPRTINDEDKEVIKKIKGCDLMNNNSIVLVQKYIDTEYSGARQRELEVEILRRKFVADFPVDEIINMSLDDYVIAAKEYVKDGSFCYRLKFELDELASMGDLRSNIFRSI